MAFGVNHHPVAQQATVPDKMGEIAQEPPPSPIPHLQYLILPPKYQQQERQQEPTGLQRAAYDRTGHLFEAWECGFYVDWPEVVSLSQFPLYQSSSAFRPQTDRSPSPSPSPQFPKAKAKAKASSPTLASTPHSPKPSSSSRPGQAFLPDIYRYIKLRRDSQSEPLNQSQHQRPSSGRSSPALQHTSLDPFSTAVPHKFSRPSPASFPHSHHYIESPQDSEPERSQLAAKPDKKTKVPIQQLSLGSPPQAVQPLHVAHQPQPRSPPPHLSINTAQTNDFAPLLEYPAAITTNMADCNITPRSGVRGQGQTFTPRHPPATPFRHSREGPMVSKDAFSPERLQDILISDPGVNPYTNRMEANWSYSRLRTLLGGRAFDDIVTKKSPLSTVEYQYLCGLARATDIPIDPGRRRFEGMSDDVRMNPSPRANTTNTVTHDPFVDEDDEDLGAGPSALQGYNTFGSPFDQQQQYDAYLYRQQIAHQQQLGYVQDPSYNQQTCAGQAAVYGPPATMQTRLPARLPYQAVRGTQADAALNRAPRTSSTQQQGPPMDLQKFSNMSLPIQKAWIEAQGLASPQGPVNACSNMQRNQQRDAAPYTGFIQREVSEEAVKQQQVSPSSARTILHNPAARSSINALGVDSRSTIGGQPRQLFPVQQNPTMSKSETEKAIMEGLLNEAMAAQAPIGPAQGMQQMKELSGPQFEAFSAATRRTAGSNSFLHNVALAKIQYEKIMGNMPCDENGRPLDYDEPRHSANAYPPPAPSQGQNFGSDSWSTTDMTDESKEVTEALQVAVDWFGKPVEEAKTATLMREKSKQQASSRTRLSLGEGSEPLSATNTTPTKGTDSKEPYMSPIGTGRPHAGRASRSTRPSFLEDAAMTALQHMKDYKEIAQANGHDGFTKFGQPPAHAIDYSANGNKSLFGTEWNPPARVGRDPRHQTTMHDGRPTMFMDPPSASGSDGRGGRPF